MRPQIIEAIAELSEQHAIRGLQKAGEALERNDRDAARDFQSYTAGVKNVVSVAKAVRETGSDLSEGGVRELNLFFFGMAQSAQPKEVKQVTEIEAKPVS